MRRRKLVSPLSHTNWQPRIRQYQNYRKCMEKSRFSKNCQNGTSLHPIFSVLFLWTHKLLFSRRTWQMYELAKNKLALNSSTNFPSSCPNYPWCNYERALLCPGHNCWNACEVFLPFPFNVDLADVYTQVNSWNQHWGKGGKQYLCSRDE